MQPYINRTREAVRSLVTTIAPTGVKNNFRFGVVGYRDSLEDNPGLEYPTKVFARPDFSKPPDAVMAGLDQVKESRVSSTGFDEDPIGGVKAVLDDVDWTGLSARYVILITDAGARPSTHAHSLTRLGITEIKLRAQEQHVALMVMHLLIPAGARIHDHDPAAAQYRELTQFNGTAPLYFPIAGGSETAFQQTMETLVGSLLQNVATATGVPVESLRLPTRAAGPDQSRMRDQMRVVSEAMRLTYVGRVTQAQAPDVQTSWTTDRDLANPEIFALDIRVLLTRNQLSDLAAALQKILAAGLANRTAPETFFAQLRSAFAAAATDPQQISRAQNIGGMLGDYLEGLPYKSEIMDIDQDSWLSMGPIQQRVVLNNVESRLRLYQDFQTQSELWHDVTHSGQRGEEVYAGPLEALP
jgi:serine/threonine-protein kinase PpkA